MGFKLDARGTLFMVVAAFLVLLVGRIVELGGNMGLKLDACGTLFVVVAAVLVLVIGRLVELLLRLWSMHTRVRKRMAAQGILGPRPSSWIAGNAGEIASLKRVAQATDMDGVSHDLVPRILPFEHKCSQAYGKRFLGWFVGWEPSVNIAEPHLIQEILSSRSFEKSGMQRDFMMPLFGRGIVMAVGDDWVHQRRLVNPAFHAEKIKGMFGTMSLCANHMVEKWQQVINRSGGGCAEIEVHSMFTLLTADIIARTAFGNEYDKKERYLQLERELQEQVMKQPFYCLIPGYRRLPTKGNMQLWKINKEIRSCLNELIHTRVIEANKVGSFGSDILGLLLSATTTTSHLSLDAKTEKRRISNMTMELLIDECKSFFFAGHETSANLLTWAMMLLALHPEWQRKAREEVRQVRAENEFLDAEMLSKLKLVGMILSETLRLYPEAVQIRRRACEDVHLGKNNSDSSHGNSRLFIPKGVFVSISILCAHHDSELWGDDALEFRPERFSEGVASACKAGAYLPFGLGPKACIGRVFALTKAKLLLSMILDRFEWKLSPNYRHSPAMGVTLFPKHGMQLVVSMI